MMKVFAMENGILIQKSCQALILDGGFHGMAERGGDVKACVITLAMLSKNRC